MNTLVYITKSMNVTRCFEGVATFFFFIPQKKIYNTNETMKILKYHKYLSTLFVVAFIHKYFTVGAGTFRLNRKYISNDQNDFLYSVINISEKKDEETE